jgi:hypothetical protein
MYFLFSYVFNQSLLGRRQVIIREEDVDVYACGKMPKNPLSIIFSYRRHHHLEFSGQENRMKKKHCISRQQKSIGKRDPAVA